MLVRRRGLVDIVRKGYSSSDESSTLDRVKTKKSRVKPDESEIPFAPAMPPHLHRVTPTGYAVEPVIGDSTSTSTGVFTCTWSGCKPSVEC